MGQFSMELFNRLKITSSGGCDVTERGLYGRETKANTRPDC